MCKFYIISSLNKPNPKAESIERFISYYSDLPLCIIVITTYNNIKPPPV